MTPDGPGDPGEPEEPEAALLPGGVYVAGGRRPLSDRLHFHRRPVRTAFVFAGGGSRGAAQVGMLQALVTRGITPHAVYGASVGAINAGGFAGRPDAVGVERMAQLWRHVTRDDVFPQTRIPTPWRFVAQRESVFSNSGVRRIIEEGLLFDRLEQATVPLEVVATSLTDGRHRWFTQGPAVEAILASAALPALFPPVVVDGEACIDGGVVDNVPLARAVRHGARRVFVLLCGPMHYTPHRYRRPVEGVLTAFFIAVHARFAMELEHLPKGVEVVVFTVDTDPLSRYDDFSQTDALIAAGRQNAEQVLDFWAASGVGDRRPTGRAPDREPQDEAESLGEELV